MSVDYMHGFDPTDQGDADGPMRSVQPFAFNIGPATKVTVATENFGTFIRITHKASEGPNKGLSATLKYRTSPPLQEQVGGGWIMITDPARVAEITKKWARGLSRILKVYKLNVPSTEQLSNDVLGQEWINPAEGVVAVFRCYDKDGFGQIPGMYPDKETGEFYVGVKALDEQVYKVVKGEKVAVPGLTAEMQARQEIEKWLAKQGKS